MPADAIPTLRLPQDDEVAERALAKVSQLRALRDQHGWPEPATGTELREDPRVQLRNRSQYAVELEPTIDELVMAAALILLVASDKEAARAR